MANRGGHAPGHLRDAFEQYVDGHNFRKLAKSQWEPFFELDGTQRPIRELLQQLRSCTDIMGSSLCNDLDMEQGSTYAQGVRKIESQLGA